MLNWAWGSLFLLGFLVALLSGSGFIAGGSHWEALASSIFTSSQSAFEVSLGLAGPMCFWLGLLKVAERSGTMATLSRWLTPLFRIFFPGVPKNHPAISAMTLNLSANVLGLDNAATPFGLRAMKELQKLNPTPDVATDAQVLFLVINTASVTLIPLGVMTQLHQLGMQNPSEIIVPTLFASMGASVAGVAVTLLFQKNVRRWDLWLPLFVLAGVSAIVAGFTAFLVRSVSFEGLSVWAKSSGAFILVFGVIAILSYGMFRKVPVFEDFIEGSKEGFQIVLNILPYLIAMLVAVNFFRESGALGFLLKPFENFSFKDALPTAFMRPFSGSAARALMIETIQRLGVDALASKMVAIIQGSSETTLYVLTLYFGSVGIRKFRHALFCGLFSDFIAVVLSIWVANLFF